MARSRADEMVEGWKTVARSASKPADAPRPHPNRTALPFGFLGAAAIALVLIVGLSVRGQGLGPQVSPIAGGPTASVSPSASPTPAPSASVLPTATPSPTMPAQTASRAEVTAAGQAVDRYTANLVRGEYASAWAMLAPETQTHWGSFANFRAERSAYFESVGGRYTVTTWPTDIAPITDWLSATDPASIDLRHAVLVEVTYPLIARDNAWSLYIVSPGPNGLMVYDVR